MAVNMNRVSVHPKWLVFEDNLISVEAETSRIDALRYKSFMQLIRTAGTLDRAATDALVDLDLTAGAFGALVELAEIGDSGIAPSELARRLSVARRTATLYVDVLTRHGWASREAHPEDRRMVLARLTPEGKQLLERAGNVYKGRLAQLMGDLTPYQAEMLLEALDAIPNDRNLIGL